MGRAWALLAQWVLVVTPEPTGTFHKEGLQVRKGWGTGKGKWRGAPSERLLCTGRRLRRSAAPHTQGPKRPGVCPRPLPGHASWAAESRKTLLPPRVGKCSVQAEGQQGQARGEPARKSRGGRVCRAGSDTGPPLLPLRPPQPELSIAGSTLSPAQPHRGP